MSKTASKSIHNWRRYVSSNWYEIDQNNAVLNLALCCGALWHHRENPQYRWCTSTVHPVYNCSKKILEYLPPVGLLVRTNLFIPSRFWTTHTTFDTCCLRYMATYRYGKELYRCTSTFSALNYCGRTFFKSLSCTKWWAQNFPPIFGLF